MAMKIIILLLEIFCITHSSYGVNPWEPQGKVADKDWLKIHESFLKLTKDHKDDVKAVFIGASITHNWLTDGKEVWNMYYANRSAYNYGISGDTTQNVLWRIENHELDGLNPKVVVLQIGTNNIGSSGPSEADVAHGITEVIKQLRVKLPNTKVISVGILASNSASLEKKVKNINTLLEKNNDGKDVFFLDLGSHLVDSDGKEKDGLFKDGKHLTLAGFKLWHQIMEPLFDKLYDSI